MIDNRTTHLLLPLPNVNNFLDEDVVRIADALTALDADVAGKQPALGFTAVNTASIGAPSGIAPLDATSKVPAAYLPSYVDDVLEFANSPSLPAIGVAGVIYITQDNNKTWRWSGSSYVEISGSPGTTDAVPEGATNQYFTAARVLAVALGGLSLATNAAITAGDSVLSAFGKLQKQITDLLATVSGKQDTLVSNTNIKTVGGTSLLGSGDISTGLLRVDVSTATQTATSGNDYWAAYAGVVTLTAPTAVDKAKFKFSPVNGRRDNVIDFGTATVLGYAGATATGLITLTLGAPMEFEYSTTLTKWVLK